MKPFQQDDAFRSTHVLDGVLTPDGRSAIYLTSQTFPGKTKDEDRQTTSLWRVDLAGGEPRRLTPKGAAVSGPVKTPDGKAILFSSARDPQNKAAQIYRLPLDGGEAEAITSLPQGVLSFALSPDGKWIAFAALEKAPEPPKPNSHVRITRAAYRFDPVPGYLQDMQQAIYLVAAEGGEPKALTAHDGLISHLVWSPDSQEVAAGVMARAAQEDWAALGDVIMADRDGKERIAAKNVMASSIFWTADGRQIGFIGRADADVARQAQLWLVDREGGKPVSRTPKFDRQVGGGLQINSPAALAPSHVLRSADGGSVFAGVGVGGQNAVYRIALSGPESEEPVVKGPRAVKPVDLVGSMLLCTVQDCNTPSELMVVDVETGKERMLTKHNGAWQSEVAWPDLEHVVVKVGDGTEIEGWVLKPKHVKPPYKTILYIHGGPHGAFGYGYCEDFQELVGAGYALAFANPRGSTNYGDAFSTAILGRWGHPEIEDFNTFLDELVKRGIADPDKLGVTGLSGGGHLSAWLIGHTDRFKAAVPEQGVYNMFSVYGTSDAGISIIPVEMGGHPHEQGATERYWDLSPVAHAHKCRTPTLLIQGENDVRCPMGQAEELFTILKHNGCEVEFLRLKDCNHGLEMIGPPPLRRFRMDAMKDWFDRHI